MQASSLANRKNAMPEKGELTLETLLVELEEKTLCVKAGRPFLYTIDDTEVRIVQPGCKMWDCPHCSRRKARQWAVKVYTGIEKFQGDEPAIWHFVTLTSHWKLKTFDSTLAVWPKAWAKLSTRMRRAAKVNGQIMRYVLIPEKHKDGRLHSHMMVNQPFGIVISRNNTFYSKWLRDNAVACGLGFQADIQPLGTPARAAFYTTKYIAKGLDLDDWPKHLRRIRTSQGWPDAPEADTQDIWAIVFTVDELKYLFGRWTWRGLTVRAL
jgi:hypothetical protein